MSCKKMLMAGLVAGTSVLSGCASIVNGNNQVISVDTRNKDTQVAGAICKLDNGKGTFFVTTPGTVTVHRAYDDMIVKCEKSGYQSGLATVKSSTKPMAFGNLLFGGVIGAAVDAGSGAAYDYPALITVIMDEAVSPGEPASALPTAAADAAAATVAPAAASASAAEK